MATFIHADIFFFVTTISVAVLTVFAIIIGVIVVKIVMNIRDITEKAKLECALIIKEISTIRERVHDQRFGRSFGFGLFRRIFCKDY